MTEIYGFIGELYHFLVNITTLLVYIVVNMPVKTSFLRNVK